MDRNDEIYVSKNCFRAILVEKRGKRPVKVCDCSKKAENFKRPKNREDSSNFDNFLTESIAATIPIISKFFSRHRRPKTSQNFAKTSKQIRENVVRVGVGGMAEPLKFLFTLRTR